MKRFLGFVGILGVLVGFAQDSWAVTNVSGVISTDATWTATGSPYIVTANVFVQGAETPILTIEPGVEVRFAQNQGLFIGGNSANQLGKLIANGGAGTITFTSSQTTHTKGYWSCIYFYNYADDASLLKNVRVEYGGYSYNANIYCYYASPTIRDSVIGSSSQYGISCNDSSPIITNNTISGNSSDGICNENNSSGTITDSILTKTVCKKIILNSIVTVS